MAFIELVDPEAATGTLKRIYDAAVQRAGKVFGILRVQSRQPAVLDASIRLYVRVMKADGEPLSRAQREMIATAVSRANACEY